MNCFLDAVISGELLWDQISIRRHLADSALLNTTTERTLNIVTGQFVIIFLTFRCHLATFRYINGTRLDDRVVRTDWDAGFIEGRQYGRGKTGGQVRFILLIISFQFSSQPFSLRGLNTITYIPYKSYVINNSLWFYSKCLKHKLFSNYIFIKSRNFSNQAQNSVKKEKLCQLKLGLVTG